MKTVLRTSAILLAVVAAIDPSWTSQRKSRLPVDLLAGPGSEADDIRRDLRDMDDVAVDGSASPSAVVVAGPAHIADLPSGIPISVITGAEGPNVVVDSVQVPRVLLAGMSTPIGGTISAAGMTGTISRIALELDGTELAAVEHRWSADDETYTARFEHVPASAGAGIIGIAAGPLEREIAAGDNRADSQVIVEERTLRVMIHEPRPSWAATFIRRVLEADPAFETAALTRPSRGIAASVGSPPVQLTAAALERFDVVVAGAPEELRQGEVIALEEFSRRRGGTVIFVPDRRPSGPYADRLPIAGFDEALLQAPATLQGAAPPIRGSEFITAIDPRPGVDTLASLPRQQGPAPSERSESKGSVPVIVSWPEGAGRTVFSGALDAWRYRTADDGFARFWKAQIAQAAARAPRALEIAVDPAPAAPGEIVAVTARLRGTEFAIRGSAIALPRIAGRVIAGDGSTVPVRLWPAAETGVFEGWFQAPQAGRHVVEVSTEAVSSSQPLIVAAGSRQPRRESPASLRQLAAATGGVEVSSSDQSRLRAWLAGIPRPLAATPVHPARSTLWTLTFVALLAAEWWLRRRQGHA